MQAINQSKLLQQTHYELRGKISSMANQLIQQKHSILKLHLGNPAIFNLDAPTELLEAVSSNLKLSQGYCDSKGLINAREAIVQYNLKQNIQDCHPDRTYIGSGASELINFSLAALLNPGDEVLLPQPVYPLWSAVTTWHGGVIRFYQCDENNDWQPNIQYLKKQITANTKAIVVINPNNPTGSVYPKKTLQAIAEIAQQHQLVIFSDEIYANIVQPDTSFTPMANITQDALVITFSGLSKNYLLAGFRCAWMTATGATKHADDYLNGIEKCLTMRLCANVPVQHAIPIALSDSRFSLTRQYPGMTEKHTKVIQRLNAIEGLHCNMLSGAFYAYPKWDKSLVNWEHDEDWVLDFLQQHHILIAPGSTFCQPDQQHFRLVLLAELNQLLNTCDRLEEFIKVRQK